MNTIFKKSNRKNLKMYMINMCAKAPKNLWEKSKKATVYNVVIVFMKNPFEKKIKKWILSYIDIVSLKHIVRNLLK
jgi:hypothetical protein